MTAQNNNYNNDDELARLWAEFANIPLIENSDNIEIPFIHFPIGTDRFEIWSYFDDNHSKGVICLIEPATTEEATQ